MQTVGMTPPQMRESALPRPFLLAGLIAPILFTVVYLIDGATRPEYDPLIQWVSHLSLGPRGWLGTLNLAIAGVLTLAFALGLRQTLKPAKRARWAVRLVFLAGIGWLMGAAFPMDPNLLGSDYSNALRIDEAQQTITLTGHWWYQGAHTVNARPKGSEVIYRVSNVARKTRILAFLHKPLYSRRMRQDFEQMLRQVCSELDCKFTIERD